MGTLKILNGCMHTLHGEKVPISGVTINQHERERVNYNNMVSQTPSHLVIDDVGALSPDRLVSGTP